MASNTSDACMVEFVGISITTEIVEAPVTNSLSGADDDLDGETERTAISVATADWTVSGSTIVIDGTWKNNIADVPST